ncbi:hypothetical protein EAE99_001180 [Botrytis elliptica]|nr:hypothetical protein EAE99_001180 [Botrytis elliptica]
MRRESQPPKQKYISARTTRSAAQKKSAAQWRVWKMKHLDEDAHPINSVINRRSERDTKKTSVTTAVMKG